ncbi:MAG: LysM peptidoglycan-binding domain-containing protein [Verrucomicrobiota bacterium]|nr:LysM peptidoglycan-binding domain-containing protein [Verrucomicrobiota bacterium]
MVKIILAAGFLIFSLSLFGEITHVVKKNETLGGIAQKYGVSTSALQVVNSITNPNLLFVGKKLKIPSGNVKQINYVIQKGDSLGSISSRFGVKLSTLVELNNISRPDLIRIGQKIIIPLKGTSVKPNPLLSSTTLSALNKIRASSGKWKRIVIHHSATPTDDAMNMHRVHKARGMKNGLAYHFVISNGSRKAYDGEIFIGDRWKGQLDGGHMKRLSDNKTSIGICLIGNFELRSPTSKQMKSLEGLCEYLMNKCRLSPNQVTTHKILHPNHTVCPGKYFSLSSLRKRIS